MTAQPASGQQASGVLPSEDGQQGRGVRGGKESDEIRAIRWTFAVWLLILAAMSLGRGMVLWGMRPLLAELASTLSPPLLVLFVALSIACGIGLTVSVWGLWRRHAWARIAALICIGSYFLIVHGYTWLFVRSGLMWERRWASLILAIAALAVSIVALTFPRSRRWLGLG